MFSELVVRGLVQNPSVPADALVRLLRDWPDALTSGLHGRARLPMPLQEAMAGHPSRLVRSALGRHPDVNPALRVRLLADDDSRVRLSALEGRHRPPLPPDALEQVLSGACEPPPDGWLTVDEYFEEIFFGDVGRIRAAAQHPDPRVRRQAASRKPELLLDDPDPLVAAAAAERHRPRVPADLPGQHCHMFWVVLHMPLSRELAEQVVASGDVQAMRSVGANPTTPADLVETLSRHADAGVRAAVTDQDLTADQVRRLAGDPDPSVRGGIAHRADLPDDLVRRLAADPDPEVRRILAEWALVSDDDRAALILPEIDLPRAIRWARSDNPRLRRRAASVTGLPTDLVAVLADDPDAVVREKLATTHPEAPGELLLRCFLEGHARQEVLARPQFPFDGLARFATHDDPRIRALALHDPALDPATADLLTRDPDDQVRVAAVRCPRLPADRLTALLDDPFLAVDAAANPSLDWEAALERIG
ncbi:hypothetical protein [Actinoplanes subglobosus]|uniref:Leucine rich repeat variant n=1 Tax=Actinoplanes subglobosus TaxID=1547892 RepID=A0ABV8IZS7_9ACTN